MEPVSLRRWLLVAVSAIAVALMWPVLAQVYGELGDALALSPWWLIGVVGAVAVQMVANWELHRIILRTDNWGDIASAQLTGNAVSHLLPGGNAIGAGVHVRMLTFAGFSMTRVVTALGAVSVVGVVSGLVVLPLIVLIASALGSNIDPALLGAMWAGVAILFAALVVIAVCAVRDRPWRWLARAISTVQRRLHRHHDVAELEQRMLGERDLILRAVRNRPARVLLIDFVRAFGDYLALYLALRATGAHVNPAAALAAFIVSNVAGMIPLTPGGLGFVEAGLSGVLTVAGATETQASLTVVTYRVAATWLPCLAAAVALAWFQHRHRERRLREVLVTPLGPLPDPDAPPGTPPTDASHTGSASPLPRDP
jgi:uncharacterized protein (TIRG00374 family)